MTVQCVWEHNGSDTLLYAENFPGAFTRGASLKEALDKMEKELRSYLRWKGEEVPAAITVKVTEEKKSDLRIADADSDVLFSSEKQPLTLEEYRELKALVLKSAEDFLRLYESISDKNEAALPKRETFYGAVPRTAEEMYQHTKNVNDYYFAEVGVDTDHEGDIVSCRKRGFEALEQNPDFLLNPVFDGSYGEEWSLRKVLRRFLWHDRIHAKAMYRMAKKTFPHTTIENIFHFE